jgi:hypothetical protein
VLQASVLSDGGEIFMLDMGVPVRILDLAERMIRLSGLQVGIDVPIEITGIRPGEKLTEALSTPEEQVLTTEHPHINRLVPIRTAPDVFAVELQQLEEATLKRDHGAVRTLLFESGPAETDTAGIRQVGDAGSADPVDPVDRTAPLAASTVAPVVVSAAFDWPDFESRGSQHTQAVPALGPGIVPPDSATDQVLA